MYKRRAVAAKVHNVATGKKARRQKGKRKGGEGLRSDPADLWIDLDALYGACGALLGMTRREVDDHILRDIFAMLDYARSRDEQLERERWRRTLILTQTIVNTVSKRPKPLTYMADRLLDREVVLDDTPQAYLEKIRAAKQLVQQKQGEA